MALTHQSPLGQQSEMHVWSEQTSQFGSGLSLILTKLFCLLLRFELQAHRLYLLFQFPRISTEPYTEKLGQNVCMQGEF